MESDMMVEGIIVQGVMLMMVQGVEILKLLYGGWSVSLGDVGGRLAWSGASPSKMRQHFLGELGHSCLTNSDTFCMVLDSRGTRRFTLTCSCTFIQYSTNAVDGPVDNTAYIAPEPHAQRTPELTYQHLLYHISQGTDSTHALCAAQHDSPSVMLVQPLSLN
ncbi:hypothetical protein E2C01_015086 [Portunus trituberculatus]|uniref:Uncharacterized protein n=1 Tax=Portunus trituberculatus TaxID=210409 RepID=A0A5B7DLW4_PORTR|nr:hypothetical protein [Portunus trituberculatus]